MNITVHETVGFSTDLEGKTFQLSFGPGFSAGAQVQSTGGVEIPYTRHFGFSGMFKLFLATQLKAFGLSDEQIKMATDFGGCFLKGTPILMADGTYKEIQEIEIGDLVMSFNTVVGERNIQA